MCTCPETFSFWMFCTCRCVKTQLVSHLLEKFYSLDCLLPMSNCAVDWCGVPLIFLHLHAKEKGLVQILSLKAVKALFPDIIPVIKLLSRFQTKPEHSSGTVEAKKTLVDIETHACSDSSNTLVWRMPYSTSSIVKSPSVKNYKPPVTKVPAT